MPLLRSLHLLIAAAPLVLVLAGCSSGSGQSTSAALLGTSSVTTATVPSDPTSRALQVAATSARASYCSFYFDPAKLKASFIASEAAQGAGPDQLQKIDRDYEYARLSVAQVIAKEQNYCSEARSKTIKADLARHLAGDYSPPPKRPGSDQTPGLLARVFDPDTVNDKPFTYDSFFDITGKPKHSTD